MADALVKDRQIPTRTKRDAAALVRRLNAVDHRYNARLVLLTGVDSTFSSYWGVSHNLPEWAIREATKQAYRRGAVVQVDYLERHIRYSYPHEK